MRRRTFVHSAPVRLSYTIWRALKRGIGFVLDNRIYFPYNSTVVEDALINPHPASGVWLSLVERYVRDVEVASSNLVTPTQ